MRADLLLLVDGRFPAGGHAYSAGVEAAVDVGDIVDATTLAVYLDERLDVSGRVEAAFSAAAAARCGTGDRSGVHRGLVELDREYSARVPSPHLRATSRRLGRQLARAAGTIWPLVPDVAEFHQPVVLGAVVQAAGGDPRDAAAIALHHLAAAVCSAGVRLLGLDPIGLAAAQARAVRRADAMLDDVPEWVGSPASSLPAHGGTLTEILGEHHGRSDARLFVA